MWEDREIEKITAQKLSAKYGSAGEAKYANYVHARDILAKDVLPEIKGIEPSLTDHGPTHVARVLDNAWELLGDDIDKLSGIDLYCLLLSILFHDTGNIQGREDHQRQNHLTKLIDHVWPSREEFKRERYVITRVVESHCGKTKDGSPDTIKFVDENTTVDRHPVQLQQIASILRFSDELAEGRERTSLFMQKTGKIAPESKIFHEYASITTIRIDRMNGRIALTYDITITLDENQELNAEEEERVKNLLEVAYNRVVKLNQERRYAKHYCNLLQPFKRTTVAFNFIIDGEFYDLGLENVDLTDLIVPGDPKRNFYHYASDNYDTNKIINSIKSLKSSEESI